MNENLKIIAEFVDKASAGIESATKSVNEFTKGLIEGARAEYEMIKAQRAQQTESKKSASGFDEMEAGLKKLAIQFFAVNAVFNAFADAIKEADKLDDLAEKTNMSAANLQQLGYAAKLSGSSLDGLLGAFNKLGKSIDKSDEEATQQAKTFEQIGVKAAKTNGELKNSEELFYEIADAFAGMEDGPEKSAAAFRLFGSEAKNLLPLLNKGSEEIIRLKKESAELGNVSPEAFNKFAEASGKLFDNFDKLGVVTTGFFTTLSADLVPVMNVFLEEIISSAKEGGILRDVLDGIGWVFSNVIVPIIKAAAIALNGFVATVKIAGKGLGALGAAAAAVFSGDFKGAKQIMSDFADDTAKIADETVQFQDKMILAGSEAVKLAEAVKKPKVQLASLKKEAKETKSELQGMVDSLRAANASLGTNVDESAKQLVEATQKYAKDLKAIGPARANALYEEAKALINVGRALREGAEAQEKFKSAMASVTEIQAQTEVLAYEATLVGKSAEEREALIEKFKEEIALRKQLVGLTDEAAARVSEETKKANAARAVAKVAANDAKITNELLDQTTKAAQDSFSKRIQLLVAAYERGEVTITEFTRIQQEEFDKLLKKTEETTDKSMVFWQEAAKGMQNAMADFFFDFMDGKISDLGKTFQQLISRMVANALAANLGEALFGGGFEKSGKMGGAAGELFSWLGKAFGGFRANGGPVKAGTPYIVGERQAEVFVPETSGTILPSTSTGGQNINFTVQAVDAQSFMQAMGKVEREVVKMLGRATQKYGMV